MKVHHIMICFFFFTLQAGNIGVHARRRIRAGTEGGSITVACSFMLARDKRFFCKQECEDVLIETTDVKHENGRYKAEYSKTFYLSYPVLYVTISQLSKSDTGRYRCGLGEPLFPDSQEDFELIVKDAPTTSKPNYTSQLFSTSASTPMMPQSLSSSSRSLTSSSASPEITEQTERGTASLSSGPTTSKPNRTLRTFTTPASTPTTTQHLSSSSVSFTSSSSSPETTEQSEQQQTERATALLGSRNLLYLGFALLIMIAVLLVFGLLFRATRHKDLLMKAEYTHGKYTEHNGDNNCTTAAGSENQATEDVITSPLLHSAPAGNSSSVNRSVLELTEL